MSDYFLPLLLFLFSLIPGREEVAVYKAKAPAHWTRLEQEGSLQDTTRANCTFLIDNAISVHVHSFPSDAIDERIPPGAQVERWRRQMHPQREIVEGVARGGFAGLFYEAEREGQVLLAWSLSLDPDHYLTLQFIENAPEERSHYRQMRADYTIKVKGPKELIEKHRQDLMQFASSFQLIEEIPRRL